VGLLLLLPSPWTAAIGKYFHYLRQAKMQPEPHLHPHPPTSSPQNGISGEGRPTSSIYLIFSGGNKPSFSAGGICNILQDGNVCSHFIWLLILLPQSPVRQTDRQTVGKQTNTGLGQILANLYTYTIYILSYFRASMESSLRMRQGKGNAIHCPRHSDWQAGYPYTTSQLGSHPGILAEILAGILAGELQQVAHSEGFPILRRETK